MASTGLLHFLLTVANYNVDDNERPQSLSVELVMDACQQLESELRQAVRTQRELLWSAQTRIMSIAGPNAPLPLTDSPQHIAKLLLIYACKSKLKRKVIALIMEMGVQEQQQLMSIIKDAEIEVCEKECIEKASSDEMSDVLSENGRLRSRLQIAESEVNEWRRLFEEQSKKLQTELSSWNEECHRLQQLLASVNDELDIVKEQNSRIPMLKQSIEKLEEDLEETDDLRGKVHSQKVDLDRMQLLLIEKDSEIAALQDRCQINSENRDLIIKQQSQIHELIAEKEALSSSNSKLLDELNVALSDIRQLRQQLNQYQVDSSFMCMENFPVRSTDWLEAKVNELEGQLLASAKQNAIDKNEVSRLKGQVSLEQDRNTSLSSLLKSLEQKYTETTRVCSKLRKENESLHEMLAVDQKTARQAAEEHDVNEGDSENVLKDISNLRELGEDASKSRSEIKKPDDSTRIGTPHDENEPCGSMHCQQEIRLMSSALHNLVLQFQSRFLNTTSAGSSPAQTSSNLPDSISIRPRSRFRLQSVKGLALNGK